jgi:uncharacterized protein (DUF2342 family)
MRETAHFWSELHKLVDSEGRDYRWEDSAMLPRSEDIGDPAGFLKSTTVPDDLSGLI